MIWFMIAFLFIGFAPLIFGENGELLVTWVGIGLVLVFFTMCALRVPKRFVALTRDRAA